MRTIEVVEDLIQLAAEEYLYDISSNLLDNITYPEIEFISKECRDLLTFIFRLKNGYLIRIANYNLKHRESDFSRSELLLMSCIAKVKGEVGYVWDK